MPAALVDSKKCDVYVLWSVGHTVVHRNCTFIAKTDDHWHFGHDQAFLDEFADDDFFVEDFFVANEHLVKVVGV